MVQTGGITRYNLLNHAVSMANNKYIHRAEYQQYESDRMAFRDLSGKLLIPVLDRVKAISKKKAMRMIIDIIGIPTMLLGIVDNIDNGRGIILSILAAAYASLRLYWLHSDKTQSYRKNEQAIRDKELELWHKEQDKIDRMNKNKDVA